MELSRREFGRALVAAAAGAVIPMREPLAAGGVVPRANVFAGINPEELVDLAQRVKPYWPRVDIIPMWYSRPTVTFDDPDLLAIADSKALMDDYDAQLVRNMAEKIDRDILAMCEKEL